MVKLILIILFIPFLSFGQGGVNHHKTEGNIYSIDTILSTYRFTQIIAPGSLYCNPNYDSLNSIALIGGKLLYKSCRCAGWDTVSGSGGGGGSNIGDSLVVIYDSLFVHWSAIMQKVGYADSNTVFGTKYGIDTSVKNTRIWAGNTFQPSGTYLVPGDTANKWVPIGDSTDATGYATNYKDDTGKSRITTQVIDSNMAHWIAIMSKMGYTDTTAMLSNYLTAILGRVKYSDTSAMLSNYLALILASVKYSDTTGMLANYLSAILLRVKYTDTLAMLSGYASLSRSNTFTATQNTLQNIRVNQMKVKGTAVLSSNQYRTTINGDGHVLLTDTTGNLKIDLNPVNGTINVTWGRNSSSDNIANSTPFRSVSNGPSTAGIKPNFFYIQDSITGNLYVIMPVYGYGTTADSLRGIGGLFLMSKDTGRASSHGFKLVTVGLMDSAFEHFSGGGIGGTIAANQIVYGNGVNTVEGNSSFSYDPSGSYNVGFPTVGDYLELDPTNGIFRMGDYHDDLYGNSMTIGRYSTLLTGNFGDTNPGAVGLNLDFHNKLFKIGDIQGFGNSTLVTVDDPNNKVDISGDVFADNLSGTNTGDQTITLTGDVTGSGTSSFATTLKNTGTAGTYGDATHIPSVTTDAQGRITGVTTYTFTSGGGGTADTIIAGAGISVTGQAVHSYTVTNTGVITETDPIFTASGAFGITSTDKTHWTQAYDKYLVSGSYSAGTITFTTRDGSIWTVTGLNVGTITSINGLTTAVQTFSVTNTGTTPGVSSSGSVHTFNFPAASASTVTNGGVSKSQYDQFNVAQVPARFVGLGGSVISSTATGQLIVPYAMTVTNWYILSDVSGSIVIEIKHAGTSIIGGSGNKPTLSGASAANAVVSSWSSTTLTQGEELTYSISGSPSTVTNVQVILIGTKN